MLEVLQQFAQTLRPLRWVAWPLLVLCLGLFAYSVLGGDAPQSLSQPALLSSIWTLLVLSFVYGFARVPAPINKPWWRRLLRKLHRSGYWLLALLTTVATIAFVLLSLRLLIHTRIV